ncbi:MAG: hypothetical protein BGN88_04855 [Clostridiales bacterium 43-6]|nr:MAG: hypothetical protein BGN88_04855 [Clostridiales bacterium 43-6]
MNISPRERLLLIALSAVVILFGGFKWLIEPGMKDVTQVQAKYDEARNNKNETIQKINLLNTIGAEITKKQEEAATESAPFFPQLSSDVVQLYFKKFFDLNGIKPTSFTISAPEVTQITPPAEILGGLTYPLGEAAAGIESDGAIKPTQKTETKETEKNPSKQQEVSVDSVEKVSVVIQFEGSHSQIVKFVNDIYNDKRRIRFTTIDISVTNEKTVASINTELYGVVKVS